jgi:hypothetical protein
MQFEITADETEIEHQEAVKEAEAAAVDELEAAAVQAAGDILFTEETNQEISTNPELKVINQMPIDQGGYKISYHLQKNEFTVAYQTEADRSAALDWFAGQGFTPTNIYWMPLSRPPKGI